MANSYQNINYGKEIKRISSEIRDVYNKSRNISNFIPNGYNTPEARIVISAMNSIEKEVASIYKELDVIGDSIIKVAREIDDKIKK